MGAAGNEVMYRNLDDLNAKVEQFLADPRKRRDVARYLQNRVCNEFTFRTLSKKILADEPAWRRRS
jgi:spore maturation protein CgeB